MLRACISPALCNSHLFVLQQGRGAPSPPRRVPRAAPGTGSVPASHGERQGLGWGMLLQKSRLRRRALSQPPGPWPSVGGAPGRDRLCSVVFGTGFTLRAPGMNHDGYKGDFPSRKQSLPQTITEPPFWTLCMDGFLSVCPEVVFHCRLGVGRGEQHSAKAQQRLVLHLWPRVSHFTPS